jgi:hypothetical protein
MSNIFCHLCNGLVDQIGLQPEGVRLCDCRSKLRTLIGRNRLLEAEHKIVHLDCTKDNCAATGFDCTGGEK